MSIRKLGVLTAVCAAAIALAPAAAAAPGPRAACPDAGPDVLRCLTTFTPGATRALADGPIGWGADDLASAYRLPASTGPDTVVGISIAYDAPNLEGDLATYRAQYGLPPCTTANGCFRKVNQQGAATPLPAADFGWAIESTLDVSMVSAACPSCRIVVVEGTTPGSPTSPRPRTPPSGWARRWCRTATARGKAARSWRSRATTGTRA